MTAHASEKPNQMTATQKGEIEFRVGSSKSTVISGARVIVLNHDGNIVTTGLTNASGAWMASVPYYEVNWNAHFAMKGIVNAIVIANGYNEQAVFVVPITKHTIQPVVLQPIVPNNRNMPSQSLGQIHHQDLRMYIDRYAAEVGLKKQPPIQGDFDYAPWSPDKQSAGRAQK